MLTACDDILRLSAERGDDVVRGLATITIGMAYALRSVADMAKAGSAPELEARLLDLMAAHLSDSLTRATDPFAEVEDVT